MSTYELDDNLVRAIAGTVWSSNVQLDALAGQLREQLPLPTPVKIGAVVRTTGSNSGNTTFVRWTYDVHSTSPWIATNDVDETYRTDLIGRIVEVLAEGVDL